MNPEIINKLEILANKLGTTAEHLLNITIKQIYIDAILYPLITLTILLLLYFILSYAKKERIKTKNEDEDTLFFGIQIICHCMLLFFYTVSIFITAKSISYLLNPEYHAIKNIIKMVTQS